MAQFRTEWLEHRRRRSMRPDADRYIRPDAHRFMRPDAYRWLSPDHPDYHGPRPYGRKSSPDQPRAAAKSQGAAAVPDVASDAELQDRRLALATLRLEWELLKFAWKRRKAGFNPDQPRDDRGRWADGPGSVLRQEENTTDEQAILAASRGGGLPRALWNLTVREFVSRHCEGRINRELPGQFDNVTIVDLLELRKGGDAAADKCYKLLNQPRFRKSR